MIFLSLKILRNSVKLDFGEHLKEIKRFKRRQSAVGEKEKVTNVSDVTTTSSYSCGKHLQKSISVDSKSLSTLMWI